MIVSEIMNSPDKYVLKLPVVSLKELADAVNNGNEGVVFITDGTNILKGVVTDADVKRFIANGDTLIDNILHLMNTNPTTIDSESDASIALRIMRERSINVLPVMIGNKQIIGILTLQSLLSVSSPERLYIRNPEQDSESDENIDRHVSRYKFAEGFLGKNGIFLDCACGSGYGTKILSSKAQKIVGADFAQDAIDFANSYHSGENIEYICKDVGSLSFDDSFFDAIVSYETLEHLPQDKCLNFLNKISNWLKPDGLFIGSSPMLRYKNGQPYITNAYHINEMPKEELIRTFHKYLNGFKIHVYHQKQNSFVPLCDENSGFCIIVARKRG
ncbi:MAG: methyltransferase domain-containing protein [Phycisphaerae bacterium]|nr:methyltransferase domain-containing protein [Phycisphaerae bacterium]MDD5381692.1 methyltransferase domain-containing protein [Phycisphaerae bacterium]